MLIASSLRRCIFCLAIATTSLAQSPIQEVLDDRSLEDYADLLDVVFPRDLGGTVFGFAIRLKPSFNFESQFVIRVHLDKVAAEIMTVRGRSAWEVLSDRRARGRVRSIDELADLVDVERFEVDVNRATANRWQMALFDALRASTQALEQQALAYQRPGAQTINVMADGVVYEVWYSQNELDAHFKFLDRERAEKPNSPLGRWIAEVVNEADQRRQPAPKR